VARATPSLLIAVERDGTIALEGVNYAFRELTGYTDEEAVGAKFWDLVAPPELIKEVRRAFEEQVETGLSAEHETAWIGKSGNWRIVAWWLRPLGAFSGKYIVCGTDVTERKAQEAELRASRSRIVEAADDARMRLERNLHDGAQQRLVSLSLALRLAQARLREDPDGAEQLLGGASDELQQALGELRELARGIHPAVLTDRGLPAALEALASRTPLPVELSADLDERLPGPVEAAAYYVVAEALTNVAKYAEASSVEVRAQRQNGRVVVEVEDDGVGGADPARGSGLRGLADRVEALEGELEVTSAAGSGTTVRAVIPLSGL
jgi:PAS domain S-box-containing protein